MSISPERIVVTEGSGAAFILAFLVLFDQGARIAFAEPGYRAYRNTAQALDLLPVPINADAAEGFIITASAIRNTPDLDGAARRPVKAGRKTGAKSVHFTLSAVADCGDQSFRLQRRAGQPREDVQPQQVADC